MGDSTYLTTATGASTMTFTFQDMPVGAATITNMAAVVRGRCANGASTAATQTINVKVGGTTTRWTGTYTFPTAGVQTRVMPFSATTATLTKANVDGATLEMVTADCGTGVAREIFDVELIVKYGSVSSSTTYLGPTSGPSAGNVSEPMSSPDGLTWDTGGTTLSNQVFGFTWNGDPQAAVTGFRMGGRMKCGVSGGASAQQYMYYYVDGTGGVFDSYSWTTNSTTFANHTAPTQTVTGWVGQDIDNDEVRITTSQCNSAPRNRYWDVIQLEVDTLTTEFSGTVTDANGATWSGCDGCVIRAMSPSDYEGCRHLFTTKPPPDYERCRHPFTGDAAAARRGHRFGVAASS